MQEVIMPGGMTLKTLNLLVAQLENADGPLTGMRIEGRSTILQFDETAPKPSVFAAIQLESEVAPPSAAGVCAGRIFVEGEETACAAYRAGR
ncbi:MAG: hypothetical protein WDN03_04535 [Rhizomicrobium sp.]